MSKSEKKVIKKLKPVILKNGEKSFEVLPGASIIKAAENVGVPFSCYEGVCDTCQVEIVKGADNLTPKTENEELMQISENHRLCCQTKMKKTAKGTVEIKI